jgi:hypothetical protein
MLENLLTESKAEGKKHTKEYQDLAIKVMGLENNNK